MMSEKARWRVLMLSWEYPPHVVGGLGKHVMELVPALQRQGIDVHLITPAWAGGQAREVVNGATVHRVPLPALDKSNLHRAASLANLELEPYANGLAPEVGGFDLIHAHDWLVSFAACALKRSLAVPLVTTLHATERGRGGGYVIGEMAVAIHDTEQSVVRASDRLIVTSQYMARQVQDEFGVAAAKLAVVANGVDTGRFDQHNDEDLSAFRARYARPEEPIIYFVGRVEYQKGVHTLLGAVPRVLAKYTNARFVIAGTGLELDNLRRRAEELQLKGNVLFLGYVNDDDRDRLYCVADVAVFPSLYEPFGIVALEAMAAQCPVVVTGVGGLQEVVRCQENGITVYPGDADSLTWGILQILDHPDLAATWAAAAYRYVREKYNWDTIASLTAGVYSHALGRNADDDARTTN
jgi:glycogen(starch) synthase